MAAHQVFSTAELLEAVLVNLELRDVLCAQGISSRWQDIINASTLLQQKLFFRPAKQTTTWLVDVTNQPAGAGPLYRYFESEVRVRAAVSSDSDELKSHFGLVSKPVQMHPICLHPLPRADLDLDFTAFMGTSAKLADEFVRHESLKRGSWLDMLLTQPPVHFVTLEMIEKWVPRKARYFLGLTQPRVFPKAYFEKVLVPDGIRFRDVLRAFHALEESILNEQGPHHLKMEYVIHTHGALTFNEEDEELVRARTKGWRDRVAKGGGLQDDVDAMDQ